MGGGASLLSGESEHQRAVESGCLRGREIARHHDRRLQGRWWGAAGAVKGAPELVDDILDIGRTRLKYRIR